MSAPSTTLTLDFSWRRPSLRYCSDCSGLLGQVIPPGDSRPRLVCQQCGAIYYENPKIVTGCLPQWENKILLCQRAIEPRYGYWTLPAGFLENGETIADGAMREAKEEANLHLANLRLFAVIDVLRAHQVHIFYLADMVSPEANPGTESLATALYEEPDIPWKNLSFPVVRMVLEFYYQDLSKGNYSLHTAHI